jgi:hypothetical protein
MHDDTMDGTSVPVWRRSDSAHCISMSLRSPLKYGMPSRNALVRLVLALCFPLGVACSTDGSSRLADRPELPNAFAQNYAQVAPTKYRPPPATLVFDYQDMKIDELYTLLFSDFIIVGRSRFSGPHTDPVPAGGFGNSIGADVVVTTSQLSGTQTIFRTEAQVTTGRTMRRGRLLATTYGTQIATVPIEVNRFVHEALFLRKTTLSTPPWEHTKKMYDRVLLSEFDGEWFNEHYSLEVYRADTQVVGFVRGSPRGADRARWGAGQLKFIFGLDSGVGIYLTGNKSPQPASFKMNKFGHLEVTLASGVASYAFAREAGDDAANAPSQALDDRPPRTQSCVASQLPEWGAATARGKRDLLRRCAAPP